MAGQGDINRPDAWTNDAPTLGVGSLSAPPAHGDIVLEGPSPTDPDRLIGSLTFQAVASALGVGAVATVTGSGQPEAPRAWAAVAPTLGVGALAAPPAQGEIMDPEAWSAAAPTLGVGAIAIPPEHGDVGDIYAPNEFFAGVMETWAPGAVTLGIGAVAPITGQGDITDPFAWQDAVFFLTSQIYPLVVVERFMGSALPLDQPQTQITEHVQSSAAVTAGTLTLSLVSYTNWPVEHIQSAGAVSAGTLVLGLVSYTNGVAEHVQSSAALFSGTLTLGLITYTNWPAEHIQSSAALTGGTLA